jgi:peptide/nickel transport system ATP-binding protein
MPTNALEIKNLTIRFAGAQAPAVKGAAISVAEASFTSVVGESGSGKTVTALAVGNLLRKAEVSGELKASSNPAYVFQDPYTAFNPLMRLGEQLTEVNRSREKALQLLSRVKIRDAERVYRSYPHEVSGGQRQRVAIAMALMGDPKLLIADEPTTALDALTQHEIMELLASIQREMGLSILFITHDLPLAAKYSDTIYVMQKGAVVERAEKKNGQFAFTSDYAKRLFEC